MTTAAAVVRENRWILLLLLPLLVAVYATVVPGMVAQWSEDPNYSHGFLVPLISAWFLWQRKDDLKCAPARSTGVGLPVLLLGLLMLVVGIAGTEYFTMRASLVVVLTGIVLYWFGWEVLKIAALPLGFLIFMVPLPYIVYDAIAFPLKLFVAKFSVLVLKAAGVVVLREGNIIMFPNTILEVADACSGLRSLVSLLALAVAYAFLSQKTGIKRTLVILSAVPIAIVTNMTRVVATGFLAQYYGADAAEGFFHEFAGLAVFALAMVLLVTFGGLLRKMGKHI